MKHILNKQPKYIQAKLKEYFDNCDPHIKETEIIDYKADPKGLRRKINVKTKQLPYTITGIANTLGLTPKQFQELADTNYIQKKGSIRISPAVKKLLIQALQRVEEYAERNLYTPGKVQGSQFVLKNIGDWKDKIETDSPGLSEAISSLEKSIGEALKGKK